MGAARPLGVTVSLLLIAAGIALPLSVTCTVG